MPVVHFSISVCHEGFVGWLVRVAMGGSVVLRRLVWIGDLVVRDVTVSGFATVGMRIGVRDVKLKFGLHPSHGEITII